MSLIKVALSQGEKKVLVYLRGNTGRSAGILLVLAVEAVGVAVVVLHHLAPLQRLQRVGIVHRLLDGHRILAGPLADLLVHLGHLLRVHGPEAALPLVRPVHGRLFNLLEAFVEGEVVTDRVLPAVRGRLEVGKVLTKKRKECK